MRQSNASGVRNDLLQLIADRVKNIRPRLNETLQSVGYGATVAPHAFIQRAIYTPPSGREAEITIFTTQIRRATVAGVLGVARVTAVIKVGASGNRSVYELKLEDNTQGATVKEPVINGFILHEGDEFKLSSADASTGGTVQFDMGLFIREYDA